MRPQPLLKLALLSVAAAATLLSCRSAITGNEGNLRFSYVADDQWLDFNKPIAVGAKLELKVESAGVFKAVEVLGATSTDEGVLKVVSFSGDRVIVEGIGDGNVLLSVTARRGGDELEDSVNLNVRVPDELILVHTCEPGATESLWLTDNDVFFQYEMKQNGRPVIGYGYHPLTFDPPVMSPDPTTKDQQWMHLTTPTTEQTVTLASTVDDTTGTMRIVAPAAIDGATLHHEFFEAWVNTPAWVYVLPTVADKPICQAQTSFTVASVTTDLCDVSRPADDDGSGPRNEWGWVRVQGKAVGVCEFAVTYDLGSGGAGTTVTLSVDVNEVVQPQP